MTENNRKGELMRGVCEECGAEFEASLSYLKELELCQDCYCDAVGTTDDDGEYDDRE